MDIVDVGRPVDGSGVEGEGSLVIVRQGVEKRKAPVDSVTGIGLGVGAVELNVPKRPLGGRTALLEL